MFSIAAAAVVFAVVFFTYPKKYESKAWIQVLSRKPVYVFEEKEPSQLQTLVATQFSLIKSPLIVDKVLEAPKVANLNCIKSQIYKQDYLTNRIRFNRAKNSELFSISVRTNDASSSEIIVNAVVDAYLEYIETQSQDWHRIMLQQLTLELNRHQANARFLQDEIRSKMEEAAKKGGTASMEGGMSGGFAHGESLQRDLYLAESKLDALKAEKKMLHEMKSDSGKESLSPMAISNVIANDQLLKQLNDSRSVLEMQSEAKKEVAGKDDPSILALKDKIDAITKRIEERRKSLTENSAGDAMKLILSDIERKIWEKSMEIRTLEIYVENLWQRYKDQINAVNSRTTKIVDLTFQTDQLKRINGVLDLLSNRVIMLQTEINGPMQIQLRKKAALPIKPTADGCRLPAASGAAALAFVITLLGLVCRRKKCG